MDRSESNMGLIAGQGRLPILVAAGMREAGHRVCCIGLRGSFDTDLPEHCDQFSEVGLLQLARWGRRLRKQSVTDAVMVGAVTKTRMHDPFRLIRDLPDWRALRLWYRRLRNDRRTPALLAALADDLADQGITLIDSTTYIPDHMASLGVMGRVEPTPQQRADIEFGWPLLQRIVNLDIGQSMAVRERDVIAVEAVEGTDNMIRRAGDLCRKRGWILFKSARHDHDMRADVPTIGVQTIESVSAARCSCIAIGAGRVILVDRPAVIAAADAAGIAIVGVDDSANA